MIVCVDLLCDSLLGIQYDSLLVYVKETYFCILIIFCNFTEFISSSSFWIETLGFLMYSIINLQKVTLLLLSFTLAYIFIFLVLLLWLELPI